MRVIPARSSSATTDIIGEKELEGREIGIVVKVCMQASVGADR